MKRPVEKQKARSLSSPPEVRRSKSQQKQISERREKKEKKEGASSLELLHLLPPLSSLLLDYPPPLSLTIQQQGPAPSSLLLLGGGLGDLAGAVLLLHGLDDADGDRLAHVAHGEAAERRVGGEGLDAHRLGGHHLDVGGVAVLDELGRGLELLAGAAVDLGLDLGELARDVGRVAVEHGGVAVGDLFFFFFFFFFFFLERK